MEPIGPLMREHRLIERMIDLLRAEAEALASGREPDLTFLESAVDFIRTYADRCHHGKEEDILFKALLGKAISDEHSAMLERLMEDHRHGRALVGGLVEAMEGIRHGGPEAVPEAAAILAELAAFYPEHIRKEDKEFFFPILDYFTTKERQSMLDAFDDFDRALLHRHYAEMVKSFEPVSEER
jgi:hemerythrin-like domain-containing protein